MRTIWHSLAWKEWHEHMWKLVALTAILLGVLFATWPISEDAYSIFPMTILFATAPLAIFVGMATAANERSRGTLEFLQALPVPLPRVAFTKLVFGLATVVVPLLIAIATTFAGYAIAKWLGFDHTASLERATRDLSALAGSGNLFLASALTAILFSSSLYLWSIAYGINRPDEISAGAFALSGIVGWWTVLLAAIYFFDWAPVGTGNWLAIAIAVSPGGIVSVIGAKEFTVSSAFQLAMIVSAIAMYGGLAAWFIWRYGRVASKQVRSPRVVAVDLNRPEWLPAPRRSPLTAIIWKQFRESGPLVLVGLSGVVGITALMLVGALRFDGAKAFLEVPQYLFGSAAYLGVLIALIVGIGVFLYDLSPKLHDFWRSRPIAANQWFWLKYLTGLVIVIVAFQLPMLVGFPSAVPDYIYILVSIIQITIYSSAVAMTCLLRHAVYGAILTIAVLYIGVAPGYFIWGNNFDEQQASVQLLLTAIVATILAWLAVRNDWGWKAGRG